MRIAAAVFVKTPGFSPVKTRLARAIGEDAAREFYSHSADCAAEVLGRTSCAPFWAVAEREALGEERWSRDGFGVIAQGEGGLGERLDRVYRELLARAGAGILLGADCPSLCAADIERAASALRSAPYVMGPALDGGFYLFGGSRAVPRETWLATPYSAADTGARLVGSLESVAPVEILVPRSDVDEPGDLRLLRDSLAGLPELVPAQRRLLSWLESRISSW